MGGCVTYQFCVQSTPHPAHQWATRSWTCCPGVAPADPKDEQ